MDKNEYDKNVYNPDYYFKSEYIIIPRDKRGFKDDDGNKLDLTLEEEYDLTKKYADVLKKYSNGTINMYKTGSYRDTALIFFDKVLKYLEPDELLQDEALWIMKQVLVL
jgi:hypothetical protein